MAKSKPLNDAKSPPQSVELTIIAMVRNTDRDRVDGLARQFPPSNCQQLPPHVRVLSEIFIHGSELDATLSGIEECLVDKTEIAVQTAGVSIWPFQKYDGYVVSLDIAPHVRLTKLRGQVYEATRVASVGLRDWVPSEYRPHLTLQLSIDQAAADGVKSDPIEIAESHFHLDEIMTLRRGGSFFGWTAVQSMKLSAF